MDNTFDVETRVSSPALVIQKPNGAGIPSTGSVHADESPDGTTEAANATKADGADAKQSSAISTTTSEADRDLRNLSAAPVSRSSKPLFDVRLISSQALLERPVEPR